MGSQDIKEPSRGGSVDIEPQKKPLQKRVSPSNMTWCLAALYMQVIVLLKNFSSNLQSMLHLCLLQAGRTSQLNVHWVKLFTMNMTTSRIWCQMWNRGCGTNRLGITGALVTHMDGRGVQRRSSCFLAANWRVTIGQNTPLLVKDAKGEGCQAQCLPKHQIS